MTNHLGRELSDADRASREYQTALEASTRICNFIRSDKPGEVSAMALFDCIREIERWYRFYYRQEVPKW